MEPKKDDSGSIPKSPSSFVTLFFYSVLDIGSTLKASSYL
jgi:hypothetical protein